MKELCECRHPPQVRFESGPETGDTISQVESGPPTGDTAKEVSFGRGRAGLKTKRVANLIAVTAAVLADSAPAVTTTLLVGDTARNDDHCWSVARRVTTTTARRWRGMARRPLLVGAHLLSRRPLLVGDDDEAWHDDHSWSVRIFCHDDHCGR